MFIENCIHILKSWFVYNLFLCYLFEDFLNQNTYAIIIFIDNYQIVFYQKVDYSYIYFTLKKTLTSIRR